MGIERRKCPTCGREIRTVVRSDDLTFCNHCGAQLSEDYSMAEQIASGKQGTSILTCIMIFVIIVLISMYYW